VCGRYAAARDAADLAIWFEAEHMPAVELPPRYNVAPTFEAYLVTDHDGTRSVDIARWGLIPSCSRDASHASRMINARSETVADKPAYRSAFKRRRCLVPVDGYYEWQAGGPAARAAKQPFFIHDRAGDPLALAGLFEDWHGPEGPVRTFTVLTQDASPWLERIHDRMPVIVNRESWSTWLDDPLTDEQFANILQLSREDASRNLNAYPVSTRVNKAGNEGEDLIVPIGPAMHVG
jgi:putative SOS response-associated peptidase YedK